jgi:hypothetical protein
VLLLVEWVVWRKGCFMPSGEPSGRQVFDLFLRVHLDSSWPFRVMLEMPRL